MNRMDGMSDPEPAEDRIVRRKLSDQVLERLREMIAGGELGPGDPMPSERELMERFGVGRPAVREALQSLHMTGLITISHGERSRVGALSAETVFRQADAAARILLSTSPDNLEHLKEARRLFEIGMIRIAAEKASPTDIVELRRLVAEQRGQIDSPRAFIRADIAFHGRIVKISGNPIFAAVCHSMLDWLFNYHTDLLIWSGHETVTLREHAAIVDCLAAGDPAGAADAMRSHLDRSAELYRHRQR